METQWNAVDQYVSDLVVGSDDALAGALAASEAAGLPSIAVSAAQGKFLSLLVRASRARRVLEIGTLGGYSSIWLARGLDPDGRLITLELNRHHGSVATANLARAGLAEIATVRVGPAADTLRKLIAEGTEPFDFVFIDADKTGYPGYLTLVMQLVRRGSVIIADNVVRDGAVADSASADPNVQAVRRYLEMVAADPRLSATVLQTVGSKGYDGLAIAVVTGD